MGVQRGEIRVALGREGDGKLALVVSDSGVGLPADLDWQRLPSLGLELVSILTQQLEGTLELERGAGLPEGRAGTTFRITFAE